MLQKNEQNGRAPSRVRPGKQLLAWPRIRAFLTSEWNVVAALMIREMKTRFGRFKLGYLWAILEPMGYIGALSIVRLAFGTQPIGGIHFPLFFTMGIIPFMIFNSSINMSINTVESNQGLFLYRRIRPYHCVISRTLLEFIIYGVSVTIILIGFQLVGMSFVFGSLIPLTVLTGFFFAFCLGIGLFMAILGPLFTEAEKIIPIFIRPLFFISGVFIPAAAIPEAYMTWLQHNPLLHFIELFRIFTFENYEAPFEKLGFVFLSSVVTLLLAAWSYSKLERKILTSGTIKLR